MTIKNIKREGAKLFQKIKSQVLCNSLEFGIIEGIYVHILPRQRYTRSNG